MCAAQGNFEANSNSIKLNRYQWFNNFCVGCFIRCCSSNSLSCEWSEEKKKMLQIRFIIAWESTFRARKIGFLFDNTARIIQHNAMKSKTRKKNYWIVHFFWYPLLLLCVLNLISIQSIWNMGECVWYWESIISHLGIWWLQFVHETYTQEPKMPKIIISKYAPFVIWLLIHLIPMRCKTWAKARTKKTAEFG